MPGHRGAVQAPHVASTDTTGQGDRVTDGQGQQSLPCARPSPTRPQWVSGAHARCSSSQRDLSQANVPPCHWSVRWHCVLPGRSLPSDRWTFSVRTGSSLILPAGVDVHRVRGLPHEDFAPRTRRYGLRIREERGRERTRLAPPSRSSNSGSNAGAAGHVFVPIVLHTLRLAFVAVVRDAQGPREGPRKPGFTDDVLDDAAWQVTTRPA